MGFLTYNRLRGRIVEKYGSISAFFEENKDAIGINYQSVSNKMRGVTGFTQGDIKTWIKLLDISIDEIGEYFFT